VLLFELIVSHLAVIIFCRFVFLSGAYSPSGFLVINMLMVPYSISDLFKLWIALDLLIPYIIFLLVLL
jgi:hypothetical protein